MNAELAQYVYPNGKAVEVASDQDVPLVHRFVVEIIPTSTTEVVAKKHPTV